MFWKPTIAVVAIAGLAGAVYLSGVSKDEVKEALHYLEKKATAQTSPPPQPTSAVPVKLKENLPWDGYVSLTQDEENAFGLKTEEVTKQDQPIKLELTGRTAYDVDSLTKIRLRFDASVEKVMVSLGQKIKAGDPLVELHSTDLAGAKSDFQSRYVQWQHDKNLLEVRRDLVSKGAISRKEFVDTLNDEQKSRLDFILAGDKLRIYKVPDAEIDALLKGLGDVSIEKHQFGSIEDKARMTLVSPVDGIIIEREVVPQNYYETSSVLMVIAPLDHLWVLVNVYELDQDKVAVGQTMEIQFPFLEERVKGKVQYVANEVSKDTRAVRVRASIPNPDARLKADMVVKAMLEIPPVKGQTSIHRLAMVSTNGSEYVFVRRPRTDDDTSVGARDSTKKRVDQFERRKIEVAQERHDIVVVHSGLEPGEVVATNGSLILAQLFEDRSTVQTGQSLQ